MDGRLEDPGGDRRSTLGEELGETASHGLNATAACWASDGRPSRRRLRGI
jgi:hypothetical protein